MGGPRGCAVVDRLAPACVIFLVIALGCLGAIPRLLFQTFVIIMGYNIFFYWTHRAMHSRFLYQFHKRHHEHRETTWASTFHAGNVEHVVQSAGGIVTYILL